MLSQFIEASTPIISFLEELKFVVLSAYCTKAAVVSGCEAVNSIKIYRLIPSVASLRA